MELYLGISYPFKTMVSGTFAIMSWNEVIKPSYKKPFFYDRYQILCEKEYKPHILSLWLQVYCPDKLTSYKRVKKWQNQTRVTNGLFSKKVVESFFF